MHRAFADAIILEALQRDPERVSEAIAKVARQLEEKGHLAEVIRAAIAELLNQLDPHLERRH